jgi:hypothetical protein
MLDVQYDLARDRFVVRAGGEFLTIGARCPEGSGAVRSPGASVVARDGAFFVSADSGEWAISPARTKEGAAALGRMAS